MSTCFINSGVQLGCSDSLGGIQKVYILGGTSGATITGVTYNANNEVTGVTGNGTLYGFDLKRNTSSLTQTISKSFENGSLFFLQELLMVFYRYDQDKADLVYAMAKNDQLKVVAIDQNGTQYLLGQDNGLFISAGTLGTGVNVADRNGVEITLQGQEPEPARVITGALATVFTGFTISG